MTFDMASHGYSNTPFMRPRTKDINTTNDTSCHLGEEPRLYQECCDETTKLKIKEAISGLHTSIYNNNNSLPTYPDESSCPPYFCTLNLSAPFFLKHEPLDQTTITASPPSPQQSAGRPWKPVHAELRGTVLLIHETEPSTSSRLRPFTLLNRALHKLPPPYPSSRSYTLQSGKAGIAPDYLNRSWVIRVRVENEQFLLAADNSERLLEWVAALNQGIDISAPLEVRAMPGYRSLRKLSSQSSEGEGDDCEG